MGVWAWLWLPTACAAAGAVFFAALLWTGGITPAQLWRAAHRARVTSDADDGPSPADI